MKQLDKDQRKCLKNIFDSFLDKTNWEDHDREEATEVMRLLNQASMVMVTD
jgi:hypothetical protein